MKYLCCLLHDLCCVLFQKMNYDVLNCFLVTSKCDNLKLLGQQSTHLVQPYKTFKIQSVLFANHFSTT